MVTSSYSAGFYNISLFRISKINRTAFGLNVNAEIHIDFDEKVLLAVDAYYKRSQSLEYSKSPYEMAKKPFPDHFRKHYDLAKKFTNELSAHSNIPLVQSIEIPYIWKKVGKKVFPRWFFVI